MKRGSPSGRRDRRETGRAQLDTTARVHLGSSEFVCATRDLSIGGIALTANEQAPAGSFLRLVLRLPGTSRPIDLDGVLVRTAVERGMTTWGLEFHEPTRHVVEAIARYVADNRDDQLLCSSVQRLHSVRLRHEAAAVETESTDSPVQLEAETQAAQTLDDRLRELYKRALHRPEDNRRHGFWLRWGRDSDS